MTESVNPIHNTPQTSTACLSDPNCTHKIKIRPCNFLYTIIVIAWSVLRILFLSNEPAVFSTYLLPLLIKWQVFVLGCQKQVTDAIK